MYAFLILFVSIEVCYGKLVYPELLYKIKNQEFIDKNSASNCFYLAEITFTRVHTIVPYCLRSSKVIFSVPSSIHGESFESLYQQNVTSNALLIDHAALDIIEDYEIYLQKRQLNMIDNKSDTQFYYKCNRFSFGTKCQFEFLMDTNFRDMVFHVFEQKKFISVTDVLYQTNGTCFEEYQCTGRVICLDWREICDGHVDCLSGEDEELCSELETNECDPLTEYRCKNGHCIPQDFFFDGTWDCLDKTDEKTTDFIGIYCHLNPLWFCEDSICDPSFYSSIQNRLSMSFTCGDGQCIEIAITDLNRKYDRQSLFNCGSGRDKLYSQRLFESPNECLEQFKCSFKFEIFKEECQSKCETKFKCADQIKFKCFNRSLITFPLKPIYDNHVFFVYELNRTGSWALAYEPSLICFDSIRCPQYRATHVINGRTCASMKEYYPNLNYWDWRNVYISLETIFRGCSLPGLASTSNSECSHPSLFHCSNSVKCISKHRLNDHVIDCYNNVDESYNTTCDLALPHRFHCTFNKQCIPRRFLSDASKQCDDGSDELIGINCEEPFTDACDILAGRRNSDRMIAFGGICDGIEHIHPSFEGDDTDETNCDEYSCVTRYTLCNGKWNCPDGRDEILCDGTVSAFHCGIDGEKFFCIQHNGNTTELCAPYDVADDKKVDCLGSSDEREHCRKKYPFDFDRRYKCLNDSTCISPNQICDCRPDCPLQDDENLSLCPWPNNQCNPDLFTCIDHLSNKPSSVLRSHRCSGIPTCKSYADEWLCDLVDDSRIEIIALPHLFDFEPILPQRFERSINTLAFSWYCNRGIPILATIDYEKLQCLCPPAYYGNHCEYQRKRLSLILEFNAPTLIERTSVFKVLTSLVQTSNGNIVFHSEEIIYMALVQCSSKYMIDLLYPIGWKNNLTHHVRIGIYRLTYGSNQIEYRGSWFFPIKFEFLPVNRLAAQIILLEKNMKNVVSKCTNLPCVHGSCESYLNFPEYNFCHCEANWSGYLCDIKDSTACDCAPESLCAGLGHCICPLNKIGSRCYVHFDPCSDNPCGNRGTCVPLDIRALQWYCVCNEGYFGERCDQNSSRIKVQFASDVPIPPAIFVHFITLFDLTTHQVRSYFQRIGFHQTETEIVYPANILPPIIFVQLFIEKNISPLHLALLNSGDKPMLFHKIKLKITNLDKCPYIDEIFYRDFSRLPYLHRVKFYQRPCRKIINRLKCFYDDIQICLCNKFNQTDCIPFAIANSTARCTNNVNPCENNGECFQDEKRCPTSSICLCPECTFGSLCQFSTKGYISSLNTILGPYIKSNVSFVKQSRSIFIGLSIASSIFLCGLIDKFFSFITFKQSSIRQTGRGIYLLSSSAISLLSIVTCLTQFFLLLFEQIHQSSSYYSCVISEFLLRVLPITCDWLQACPSIESILIVLLGIKFQKRLSYKISKYVTGGVFLITISMFLHDPLHRHLLYDQFEDRTWCVVSFSSKYLKTYDSTINLINFFGPFSINVISSIALILLTTRFKARAKHNYKVVLREKIKQYKHLIISSILLVLLTIPRLIIAFRTTCMKPSRDSSPYLMIIGYFVSYLPYILTTVIFILPSPIYKKELSTVLKRFVR